MMWSLYVTILVLVVFIGCTNHEPWFLATKLSPPARCQRCHIDSVPMSWHASCPRLVPRTRDPMGWHPFNQQVAATQGDFFSCLSPCKMTRKTLKKKTRLFRLKLCVTADHVRTFRHECFWGTAGFAKLSPHKLLAGPVQFKPNRSLPSYGSCLIRPN